jgi:tryptophan synthase alpha chain
MSRISETFRKLKDKKEKALITYITAGDPDLQTTEKLLYCMASSGADIIELGVPFSDPMADGITIQHAFERSLKNPFSMEAILNLVQKVRTRIATPVVLFGYYNPFYQYGLKQLCQKAQLAGVDGLLVVDLPPEEALDLKTEADAHQLDLVFLLAPTSTEERIRRVAQVASGFIYYVSVTGVTGARESLDKMIDKNVALIKSHTSLPVGVGFGISKPEHIRAMIDGVDAVIVGSAIIKILEEHLDKPGMVDCVGAFIHSLKEATRTKHA